MNFIGKNLHDILSYWAVHKPSSIAYSYLSDDLTEHSITYSELMDKALNLSFFILTEIKKSNEKQYIALLMYPASLDFIVSFFACLYAGVIAVPVSVPKRIRTSERLKNILIDSGATVILTNSEIAKQIPKDFFYELSVNFFVTDFSEHKLPIEPIFRQVHDNSIAFIQYTSGTTYLPKGVVVTHENVVANQEMIRQAFGHDESTIFGGWLPLYHDMGLIGNILQPLYLGIPSILMSPVSFLRNPLSWLQLISNYRITTSGGPDFAYELCANIGSKQEKLQFDLSSWRVAFNGSEYIRAQTLRNFAMIFKNNGFDINNFVPCYGLAEATLFVSAPSKKKNIKTLMLDKSRLENLHTASFNERLENSKEVVSVGKGWKDEEIIIVDPNTLKINPESKIGEVWISGSNVTEGYWKQPESTIEIFEAKVANSSKKFLRTGDLGFLDQDRDLFILGRLKDLIIIRGRNIYPQDLEKLVSEVCDEVMVNGCAAFSVSEGSEENLIIVAELKRSEIKHANLIELTSTIRAVILEQFELYVSKVCFIRTNGIPKTSSGKIQRFLCKRQFLANELPFICEKDGDVASSPKKAELVDEILIKLLSQILKLSKHDIKLEVPLYSLGIDSITVIAIQAKIMEAYNIDIPFDEILNGLTVKDLNDLILKNKRGRGTAVKDNNLENTFDTVYDLSLQQLDFLAFEQLAQDRAAYNVGRVVEIVDDFNQIAFECAMRQVIYKHPILRTVFIWNEHGAKQRILDKIHFSLETISFTSLLELNSYVDTKIRTPFDLNNWPLFNCVVCCLPDFKNYIFLMSHHIICDIWSFGLLIDELTFLYDFFKRDQGVAFKQKIDYGYQQFVAYQKHYLKSEEVNLDLVYWKKLFPQSLTPICLPTSLCRPEVKCYDGNYVTLMMQESLTKSIFAICQVCNITPYVFMLTIFLTLIRSYTEREEITIGSTMHGRRKADWYKTLGNFVNPLPVTVTMDLQLNCLNLLNLVKRIVIDNFKHSFCPLNVLLAQIKKDYSGFHYDPKYSLLFQHMMVYQQTNYTKAINEVAVPIFGENRKLIINSLKVKPYQWLPPYSHFDLTLFITNNNDNFFGYFEYNSLVYDRKQIMSFKKRFLNILYSIIEQPNITIDNLLHKVMTAV